MRREKALPSTITRGGSWSGRIVNCRMRGLFDSIARSGVAELIEQTLVSVRDGCPGVVRSGTFSCGLTEGRARVVSVDQVLQHGCQCLGASAAAVGTPRVCDGLEVFRRVVHDHTPVEGHG